MKNQKIEICEYPIFYKPNKEKILSIVNSLLNSGNANETLVKIYIEHDLLDDDKINSIFIDAVEDIYSDNFSLKSCAKYLIIKEMKKILKQEISYFEGFSKTEKIIWEYNMSLDDRVIDSYGENIDKELAEIMHDFDIECSILFSEYDEDLAVKKINEKYKNSTIDNLIKNILEKNN